jgi:maltose alpha-D-glucosyltransferase/alpha-amylase
MTMPGIPFIYNGDEIGMNHVMGLPSKEGGYNRTGARTPMQWDRSANAGFSSADPSMLYLPIDPSPGRPTVADQEPDRASLLNAVRRLAALRKEHAALFADGHFTPILAEKGKYPFIYQRADHSGAFVIAINPSRHPVSISIPADSVPGQFRKLFGSEVSYSATHGKNKLEMPGISYAILETVH